MANNGTGNNSARDEWETPPSIFDPLMDQYNFKFDCCATKRNAKVEKYPDNFLDVADVSLVAWMNPPFSKAGAMFKHFFRVVKKGVAIYRCDNLETAIWQKEILPSCDWVYVPSGRVSYGGLDGNGARFPSALIGVGVHYPKRFNGTILVVKR